MGAHEHTKALENMTKSNLDNIVGSLWQARQESSGSSRGDQVGLGDRGGGGVRVLLIPSLRLC